MIMKLLAFLFAACIMSQTPPAVAAGAQPVTWTDPLSGIAFVWIPGGCFEMGMTPAEEAALRASVPERFFAKHYGDEPRRQACPEGFWMATREITQAQWTAVTGMPPQHCIDAQGETLPVTWVPWLEAAAFARALNGLHNGTQSFALPSEAQWETACRQQAAGGSGRAEALRGLLDAPDEWVDEYYTADGQPPAVEDPAAMRVLKGERCSNRRGAVPGYVHCGVGFRLVRLAPGPQ
ncbi:hypothetical protein DGI_2667 [Megalodesulfovibrio gigas DSM 1382 = ATCC 19364]|uniref:Sulfatase-modifying factor enzyme-like domain-containing protein n=2 Tax=Megalodesulfovibrio gigas TaxID=879 RepID=T2GDL1_MEGG1|nr:hypothetical protein DGI_2667 [Megalodesulfovibrio gigas DSM 1382 = ATCC 19364]